MTRAQHTRALRAIAAFIALMVVMGLTCIVADKTFGESRRMSHTKVIASFASAGQRVLRDATVIAAVGNLKPTSAPKIESVARNGKSLRGTWKAEVESELTSGTLFMHIYSMDDDKWFVQECRLTTLTPPTNIAPELISTPYYPPGSSAKYTSVRLKPAVIHIEP